MASSRKSYDENANSVTGGGLQRAPAHYDARPPTMTSIMPSPADSRKSQDLTWNSPSSRADSFGSSSAQSVNAPLPPTTGSFAYPSSRGGLVAEPDSYARRLSAASTVFGGGGGGASSLDTRTGSMDAQRRASDAEEVEAGLALAGLGLINNKRRESESSPPNGSAAASSSAQPSSAKKAKKEEKQGSTGGGKETRKSCQECRRLKAKCDRVFPCSNYGDLSCMQGKRLVLASTEQLHDRIAQLEAALFQTNKQVSSTHHPLLAPQYLDGGFASVDPPPGYERGAADLAGESGRPDAARRSSSQTSYSVGTPRTQSSHRMAVESLLLSDDVVARRENEWVSDNAPPAQILARAPTPDMVDDRQAIAMRLRKILAVLPPREELRKRSARFWIYSSWYQSILHREEFDNVYEPASYHPTAANPLSPHKLACVLMVLTLDTFFDLSKEEEDPKVGVYWDAAQQCFDTRFGWAASVAGVQALGLMALFVGFGWRGARASNFYFLRHMTTAVQQLGLHKEPHPGVPDDEADFRRRIFHESFQLDTLLSMNHGQRTAIPLENIETRYARMTPHLNFTKYEYMRRIAYAVIDIGLRPDSNPASPDVIRAVEEEMIKFDVNNLPDVHCPAMVGHKLPDPPADLSTFEPMGHARTTTSMAMYKSSLFLFRPALRILIGRIRSDPDYKIDDWDRKVAMTTFETCRCIVLSAKYLVRNQPRLSGRTWSTWVQVFSAAVSITAVTIFVGPQLDPTLIGQAFMELNEVCQMIDECGSNRARGVHALMPVLQTMLAARYPHILGQASTPSINAEGADMLYALLGGSVDEHGPQGATHMTESVAAVFSPLDQQSTLQPAQQQAQQHQQHQQQQPHHLQPPHMNGNQPGQMAPPPHPNAGSSGSTTPGDRVTPDEWKGSAGPMHPGTMGHQMLVPDPNFQYTAYNVPLTTSIPTLDLQLGNVVHNLNNQQPGFMPHMSQQPSAPPQPLGPNNEPHIIQGPAYTLNPLPFAEHEPGTPMQMANSAAKELSATELWARLQTFYEPTVWWGLGDGYDVGSLSVSDPAAPAQPSTNGGGGGASNSNGNGAGYDQPQPAIYQATPLF
ncbi:hypothetical protein Q8F55_005956 [Vanrija albida]|uniref:Xylanolytic transcriptional activator regulatory domain-containing protein n=1 Tax=Vanrija albida TaxID=181172 RepID=A0ABR3Q331_9TREE